MTDSKIDLDDVTVKTFTFSLNQSDLDRIEEITLAGVIAGKLAKGDYYENVDFSELKSAYESCHIVNEALHKKLNRVRRALAHPELQTATPEDELENA